MASFLEVDVVVSVREVHKGTPRGSTRRRMGNIRAEGERGGAATSDPLNRSPMEGEQ